MQTIANSIASSPALLSLGLLHLMVLFQVAIRFSEYQLVNQQVRHLRQTKNL